MTVTAQTLQDNIVQLGPKTSVSVIGEGGMTFYIYDGPTKFLWERIDPNEADRVDPDWEKTSEVVDTFMRAFEEGFPVDLPMHFGVTSVLERAYLYLVMKSLQLIQDLESGCEFMNKLNAAMGFVETDNMPFYVDRMLSGTEQADCAPLKERMRQYLV